MKNIGIINMLFGALIIGLCTSCNDLEAVLLEYKPDPKFEAPNIDPSWELELMSNQVNGRVYVYKDKKYDKLFTRTLGWNGGDGVQTTQLPDGNTFWSFNDSFYGVVESETRARKSCSFPRNSIMVQTKGDEEKNIVWLTDYVQTDNPEGERYYHARTHLRHPKAKLSETDIKKGEIDQDYLYWAGDGTVFGGKLQMLWNAVDNTDPNNLMRAMSTCLATYSLDGKPGDESYLKLIDVNHDWNPQNIYTYGSTLWEDEDGHIYLYCTKGYDVLVARTATHDLNSPIEYYIATEKNEYVWQSKYPTSEEASRSKIQDTPCSMPWVFKKGDYYYMLGQAMWFGREEYIFRSKTPYGPFSERKTLFKISDNLDKLGVQTYQNAYMFNLHPHLSRDGELVITTNTDPKSFWDNFNEIGSADFYRPYFYRIYFWERLFEEE